MLTKTKPVIVSDVTRDREQLRVVVRHADWKRMQAEQQATVREAMALFFEGLAEQIRNESQE